MTNSKNVKREYESKKKNPVKKWAVIAGAVVFFILVAVIMIKFFVPLGQDFFKKAESGNDSKKIAEQNAQTQYILETCYDGTKELDPVLFQFPFQKRESYVNNKTLITQLSEEKIEHLQNRATEFVSTFFGCDNRKLLSEYTKTEENLKDYFIEDISFIDENGAEKSMDTYIADYLKAVSDAGLQTDVEYETDKCLIYKDLNYYIRGLLNITVYEGYDDEALSAYFPFPLEKGKSYKIVLDIGLVPFTSNAADTYKVSEINVVDWQEVTEKAESISKDESNILITMEEE